MEDTLRVLKAEKGYLFTYCLNPYSNGRYSTRYNKQCVEIAGQVLILILMEDTLRAKRIKQGKRR